MVIMLGEFEYLLLTVAVRLGEDAYGAAIRHEIEHATGRGCSIGALYTTLDRLEAKGFGQDLDGGSDLRLLLPDAYWPVVHMIATETWRRWRGTNALLLAATLIGWGTSAVAQTSLQDYRLPAARRFSPFGTTGLYRSTALAGLAAPVRSARTCCNNAAKLGFPPRRADRRSI
jgi:Transcriptional regulator PadR-like family